MSPDTADISLVSELDCHSVCVCGGAPRRAHAHNEFRHVAQGHEPRLAHVDSNGLQTEGDFLHPALSASHSITAIELLYVPRPLSTMLLVLLIISMEAVSSKCLFGDIKLSIHVFKDTMWCTTLDLLAFVGTELFKSIVEPHQPL